MKSRQTKTAAPTLPSGLDLTEALRILKHAGWPDVQPSNPDRAQLQRIIDALCDLCIHDGITGLVNATFFNAVLTRELDRSLRTGRSCGLLVLDIDHFKQVNDTYGHSAGDIVLQAVARLLMQSLRSMDTAARIGGEEFSVILPECDPEDAIQAGTRVHTLLNPLRVLAGDVTIEVTTSAGLVWTTPKVRWTAAALLEQGDQEMYKAKRSGRSRLSHPPLAVVEVSIEERVALGSLPPGAASP